MKATVERENNGRWCWMLRAHNGAPIAQSMETYARRDGARRALERLVAKLCRTPIDPELIRRVTVGGSSTKRRQSAKQAI